MGRRVACRIHSAGRSQRPHRAHWRMGAAHRPVPAARLARWRPAHDDHGGQPLGGAVWPARAARPGGPTAAANRRTARRPGAGADRSRGHERPRNRRPKNARAEPARHPPVHRRLWHRVFVAQLPQALSHQPAQDRPVVRARHRHRPGRPGHCHRHRANGPQPGHEHHRRRRGNRRATGLSARARLRPGAGLPLQPPAAA